MRELPPQQTFAPMAADCLDWWGYPPCPMGGRWARAGTGIVTVTGFERATWSGRLAPPGLIQHAISLHLRFTLSYRDVEDILAERGLDVSYESVRRWVLKFGPLIARNLRQRRPRPSNRWHLDEMVVRIAGTAHRYREHVLRDSGAATLRPRPLWRPSRGLLRALLERGFFRCGWSYRRRCRTFH
jgi:hypothetical protein